MPLPTNYQPAADGQPSSSTATNESTCLGAIIVGFHAEKEVAEQDLRAALLIARHIAVNHCTSLESLVAGIAPIISPRNDPNQHPGWGNAGGLVRSLRRDRNGSNIRRRATRGRNGAGGSGSASAGAGASASTYVDDSSQGIDSEDDSSDEDGERASLTDISSGSLILSPVQHALLQSTRCLSLAFPHAPLEKQYQEWRGARMARVDGAALATLLAYHCTRTLAASSSTRDTYIVSSGSGSGANGNVFLSTLLPYFTAISRWEYLPCTILIIPFVLAVLPLTHRWYSQRRDIFVTVLYIILAWHHMMAGAAGTAAGAFTSSSPASFWGGNTPDNTSSSVGIFARLLQRQQGQQQQPQRQPIGHGCSATQALISSTAILIEMLSNMDSIWISVLSVILNVRHPYQTLMLFVAATTSLLAGPDVCPRGVGGGVDADATAMAACWLAVAARVIFAQMLLPGIAMYWLEYGARKAFCATPAASYFAWRLEGARSTARPRR